MSDATEVSNVAIYLQDSNEKIVYVNRGQVEAGKTLGTPGKVWAVDYKVQGALVTLSAYEFVAAGTLLANPQLAQPRPDSVSVYLTVEGPMLLRITPDAEDPDWLTARSFFKSLMMQTYGNIVSSK